MTTRVLRTVVITVVATLTGLGLLAPGPATARPAVDVRATQGTLVLYDTTGPWGWLGELYAQETMNLAGRFGAGRAMPARDYASGTMAGYAGVIYVGSTFDEALPAAFLDDVLAGGTPVLWSGSNIWQLQARAAATGAPFSTRYGWQYTSLSTAPYDHVSYKGRLLDRDARNAAGIAGVSLTSAAAIVLATATGPGGASVPWATRSGSLTYVGEVPYTYVGEADRYLAWADLLFDLLAPATAERHRGLVRLEDVTPASDPANLRALADALASRRVPFSVGVIPVWIDPNGNGPGKAVRLTLQDRPAVVAAIRYLQSRGGTVIEHGYTHQYRTLNNPYNGRTGTDYEFFRVTQGPDGTLTYVGPVPEDSTRWAAARLRRGISAIQAAGLGRPRILEFPHYLASVPDYRAARPLFSARYERDFLFSGTLGGGAIDYSRNVEQFFPYEVVDVYRTRVLPENLDHPELGADGTELIVPPSEIVRRAAANLVVRDGFASFFYHSFYPPARLIEVVDGITKLGYRFVSPTEVLRTFPVAR